LIGFLLLLSAGLFVVYIGMRLVPVYIQYYSVTAIMKELGEEPNSSNLSESQIRNNLSRRLSINSVYDVDARDFEIVRSNGVNLILDYEVRKPLIGNVDAVMSFRRVQALD